MERREDEFQTVEIGVKELAASFAAQALEKTQITKYHTKGGHGFSAEDANHFSDSFLGKEAEVVGTVNELNGPDRLVNGVHIQSKYCQTAWETISSAFDPASGSYRYSDQVLEVPKDQYQACVELMEGKIAQGKVPGFKNPADAEKIVQQGSVTYKQARNIARAGNVDSICFDAKTQSVTSTYVFAISFAVTFAHGCWCGQSSKKATRAALEAALAAGSTTFIGGVIGAQILRTKAAAAGAVFVRSGMKSVAASSLGREAIQRIAAGSLGKVVYGAAAINHVSKLLRSNAIISTIAVVVTTVPDFYRASVARSISWRQFTKNTGVNVAGVAGGSFGWFGGAAAGAALGSVVPIVGTAVGGVAGGIAGALGVGMGTSFAVKTIVDRLADDDAKELLEVLRLEVQELASEYMLTEYECNIVASEAAKLAEPKALRRLFKDSEKGENRESLSLLIRLSLEPKCDELIRRRPMVTLPAPSEIDSEIAELVEVTLNSGLAANR